MGLSTRKEKHEGVSRLAHVALSIMAGAATACLGLGSLGVRAAAAQPPALSQPGPFQPGPFQPGRPALRPPPNFVILVVPPTRPRGWPPGAPLGRGGIGQLPLGPRPQFVTSNLKVAQAVARHHDWSSNVTVELASGTFRLKHPLMFGAADGGRNGHQVTWEAAPGATPVISGGEQVTRWRLFNAASNIWAARVAVGLNSRNLYVNGTEAPLSGSSSPVASSDWTTTRTGFTITNVSLQAELDSLPDQSQIEIENIGPWTDHFCPVSSISGATITMQEPCWDNATFGYGTADSTSNDYLENSLAFLTTAGEWYLDSQSGELYYMAPQGQTMSGLDVELPLTQSLVDISGSYGRPVRNLAFQGIQFSDTSWLGPSSATGYADEQTNWYLGGTWSYPSFGSCTFGCSAFEATRGGWDEVPGAVQVSVANGVTFAQDSFSDLGSAGLGVGEDANANASGVGLGAQNITIANNTFSEDAADGITVGGIRYPDAFDPSNPGMTNKNILIENNDIHNVGTSYKDSNGILSTYVTHDVIVHNQIYNIPYDGIGLGSGWGMWDPGGSLDYQNRGTYNFWPVKTTATTEQDNVVSGNVIYNTGQEKHYTCCSGPFYNLSADPGAVVKDNYMYSNNPPQGGLYNDEGSRFSSFYDNVISGSTSWAGVNASPVNNADDNVFSSNWYNNSASASVPTGSPHYNVLLGNVAVSGDNWPAPAEKVIQGAGLASGLGYPAPGITTVPSATMTIGSAGMYRLKASGSPVPTFTETGMLPAGVSFTGQPDGTAVISGVPGPGSAGTYQLTVRASNGIGVPATQTFTLTVLAQPLSSSSETISGLVTNAANGAPVAGICAYLYFTPTATSPSYKACTGANGSYEIDGVVPAALAFLDSNHYEMEFVDPSQALGTEWYNGVPGGSPARSGAGAIQLEGRLGTAVTGINAVMSTNVCCTVTLQRAAGKGVALEASFANVLTGTSGTLNANSVTLSLRVPAGLTATATTSTTFASVPPAGIASATWDIAGLTSTAGTIEATASYTFEGQAQRVTSGAGYLSVSAAYNNSGISDNSSPSSANLDGAGDSFSEQSLEAVGLSPGATVTAQGISYTWPDVGPGLPDNISLAGQTLLVQASGGTLGFLGTADFGKQTATGTITYTDGTTQTFTLTYPDWFADSATGTNDQLVATGVLNGTFAGTHVGVYAAEVPLDSGKTVAAVTLPNDSDMHVFAMNAG